jgi:hypothetical protein
VREPCFAAILEHRDPERSKQTQSSGRIALSALCVAPVDSGRYATNERRSSASGKKDQAAWLPRSGFPAAVEPGPT